MNVSVETSRYLHPLKSEERAQDKDFILDVELRNNKKKKEREIVVFGQEINKARSRAPGYGNGVMPEMFVELQNYCTGGCAQIL